MLLVSKIIKIFGSGQLKNQFILSFILKGLGICCNLLVVRITLSLLTTEKYGIWISLQSVFSWIVLFDIGIGNGLRNKLAECVTKNDLMEGREYITTAYFIVSIIGAILILIIFSLTSFINWGIVFRSHTLSNPDYIKLILISFTCLIFCFVLGLINQIFNAFQKNWLTNAVGVIASVLFLLCTVFFRQILKSDLILIASTYCISLTGSYVLMSIIFFSKNKGYFPRLQSMRWNKVNAILSLGGKFFIIQIAVLLIFSIDNFLVLQFLGPSTVTEYNVVFKLFSVFLTFFGIIMGPLWSAFTAAHLKNDSGWIKGILRRLQIAMIPIVVALVIVSCLVNTILNIWLPKGKVIIPDLSFVFWMAIFVLVSYWNNIYSYYLNGISETKIQIRTAVIGAMLNIPLAIFLVKYLHLGLAGIMISMIISLSFFSIFGPITAYKKLSQENHG